MHAAYNISNILPSVAEGGGGTFRRIFFIPKQVKQKVILLKHRECLWMCEISFTVYVHIHAFHGTSFALFVYWLHLFVCQTSCMISMFYLSTLHLQ